MLRNGVVSDIQEIAIKGKIGCQAGILEPFKSLSIDQIQELRVHNVHHTSKTIKDAETVLTDILKGV